MGIAFDYRQLAAEQRRKADATPLAMVRLRHLSAAEKWEILANEMERFEPSHSPCLPQKIFF